MTDSRSTGPAPGMPEPGPALAGPGPNQYGVGLQDVPESWYAAEQLAPQGPSQPSAVARSTRIAAIPIRREGPLVACGVAAAGAAVAGMGWYFADVLDRYSGPWTPLAAAVLIAVPVRLFSRAHPTQRMLAAVVAYLVVLLTSLILLTHHDLVATYDWIDDYRIYEYSVVRTRLRDPLHLGLYFLGGVLAGVLARIGLRR